MGLVTIIFQLNYFVLIIQSQLRQGVECQLWLAEVCLSPIRLPGVSGNVSVGNDFRLFFFPYISKSEKKYQYILIYHTNISSQGDNTLIYMRK